MTMRERVPTIAACIMAFAMGGCADPEPVPLPIAYAGQYKLTRCLVSARQSVEGDPPCMMYADPHRSRRTDSAVLSLTDDGQATWRQWVFVRETFCADPMRPGCPRPDDTSSGLVVQVGSSVANDSTLKLLFPVGAFTDTLTLEPSGERPAPRSVVMRGFSQGVTLRLQRQ